MHKLLLIIAVVGWRVALSSEMMQQTTGEATFYVAGQEELHSLLVSQLAMQSLLTNMSQDFTAHLAEYKAATGESKSVLANLSQALTAYLTKNATAVHANEHDVNNINMHLLQEVEELRQKVIMHETQALEMADQLQEKEGILQKQEETIQTQNNTLQSYLETRHEMEETLQEQNLALQQHVQSLQEQKEITRKREEDLKEKEESLKLQKVMIQQQEEMLRHRGNLSQQQQQILHQTNREHETLKMDFENQANRTRQLEEECQSLEEAKVILEDQLQECRQNVTKVTVKTTSPTVDCDGLYQQGMVESGVYTIFPACSQIGVSVLCQIHEEPGNYAWTVILSRRRQTPQVDFARNWQDYKNGFGDPDGEYWLGNDNIHALTGGGSYHLRLEATNLEGEKRFAEWEHFSVAHEDFQYRLRLHSYSTISTLGNVFVEIDDVTFSTDDRDSDNWSKSCSASRGHGGWWFNRCGGVYLTSPIGNVNDDFTLMSTWYFTKSSRSYVGLSEVKLMVRRQ
ncbi:angiopoietin-related protein 7-like [Homarus americanus]|uniref:Angiopoietin-4-like 1 n=1 Tax=Homarus americanus TaxID=6706 RepID=A0A8J5JW65_HOMAM|nr:angiopoietin-related protein 7-like [Homarus americanus]XP_042228997.1 angiopoietin-related protein 7-like [Homarus americanus]KAG7164997.1 Angiopoietin-4-like 1 [Homarus americanus]KAG7172434.1 Angiopoietin-4-like 2 [Homarus americanus]